MEIVSDSLYGKLNSLKIILLIQLKIISNLRLHHLIKNICFNFVRSLQLGDQNNKIEPLPELVRVIIPFLVYSFLYFHFYININRSLEIWIAWKVQFA